MKNLGVIFVAICGIVVGVWSWNLKRNINWEYGYKGKVEEITKEQDEKIIQLQQKIQNADAKIKEFEAKKKDLRSVILKDMIESGKKTEDTAIGKFTLTKLKTWTYPEEVIEIGENFKAAKAKAESTGDATYIEEDSFRFTQIKL